MIGGTDDRLVWVDEKSAGWSGRGAMRIYEADRAWFLEDARGGAERFLYGKAYRENGIWKMWTVEYLRIGRLSLADTLIYERMVPQLRVAVEAGKQYTRKVKL